MSQIVVEGLRKYYDVHQKEPGFIGSLRAFFKRQYQQLKAVDDISFTIEAGEMVGFLGPNGAGKTTTLKVLSGLLYPTAGRVEVLGFIPHQRRRAYLEQFTLVMLLVWLTIAQEKDGPIGGYDQTSFISYYLAIIFARRLSGVWIIWDLDLDIRKGNLSAQLLRPLDMELLYTFFEAGRFSITIFPAWVRILLTFVVPVAFITTVPASVSLGRLNGTFALYSLGVTTALFTACVLFWGYAVRHYSSASS